MGKFGVRAYGGPTMASLHPVPVSRNTIRLAAAVTLTIVGGISAHAAMTSFSDVPATHWAANAIGWASDSGLMTGPANKPGTFNPGGSVNRAELAVVLSRQDANLRATIALLQQRVATLEAKLNVTPPASSSSSWSSTSQSSVASSSAGPKTWVSTDSTWRDIDQAIMKIEDGKLYRSTTNSTTWKELKPMQWQSDNGTWYRFDAKLNLNRSDDGLRWVSISERQWVAYGITYWLDYENRIWKSE